MDSPTVAGWVMVAALAVVVGLPLYLVWSALWNVAFPRKRRGADG